ncbi:nucleosome assembly protein 1-like 1 [Cryptococcus wingfieldii CBS 7118]|uniref:Nucleosome assembly protein 1-like 1 n=1 Tax=Cryptococcus wingfieldii CBS 7118 TaxID=1295528 RepID=A0A1E3IVY3_9TREE|nr:nucleosome assembly protein 1-like 1 [Cryptococcus wingfieldii CBS 7118]ODN92780.1 nucleosome assembly protein 1-like 1 [Cryptococcus wingfieldii CBS 7118]
MSQNKDIQRQDTTLDVAPTPQNTPLETGVLQNRPANLGQPSVETLAEGEESESDEEEGGANPASLLASNPALLAFAQSKLDGLVGKSSGYIESLPASVRRRIDGLKGVQVEYSKIESEFQLAILELEKKFAVKYQPLYERREAIITGKAEPTDQEVEEGIAADEDSDDEAEEEDAENKEEPAGGEDIKGIPEFWLTALKNHVPTAESISDEDEEALKHLVDVRLSYLENQPGFKLHFVFTANEFFSDSELTKTYYYQEQVGYGGDFVYDKAVGTEIQWKEEKDLTKKIEIKKQRNKSTGRTRTVRKVVPTDSFFNFFKPPQPPAPEDLEADDVDEAELQDLDARLEMDYQIGEDFKEKIIPRAVDFFTGKALEYEDYGDEDDFEDEDDYDDDEDDEGNAAAVQAAAAAQPECKQQ